MKLRKVIAIIFSISLLCSCANYNVQPENTYQKTSQIQDKNSVKENLKEFLNILEKQTDITPKDKKEINNLISKMKDYLIEELENLDIEINPDDFNEKDFTEFLDKLEETVNKEIEKNLDKSNKISERLTELQQHIIRIKENITKFQ